MTPADLADHGAELVWKEVRGEVGRLRFRAPALARGLEPGQFVMVRVPGHTLRRPFAAAWAEGDEFELVVFQVGEATAALLEAELGSSWDVLGPLGQPFEASTGPALLVSSGAGVGSGALLFLAGRLAAAGRPVRVVQGAGADPDELVLERLWAFGVPVERVPDGVVLEAVRTEFEDEPRQTVYVAAPYELMEAVSALCERRGVSCWAYLREPMACGIGACLSCVAWLKVETQHVTGIRRAHVCVDGPAFDGSQVAWGQGP